VLLIFSSTFVPGPVAGADTVGLSLTESAVVTISVAPAETASLSLTETAAVEMIAADTASSGGWWREFEVERVRSRDRRRKRDEDDAAVGSIQDAIDREIAALLHEQEAKDAERAELERLRSLARAYDGEVIDARFASALKRAAEAKALAQAQALLREAERVEDEEFLMAAMLVVIDD
jgi:hypothetical protein